MKLKKYLAVKCCMIFFAAFCVSCNSNSKSETSLQKIYGPDTDYFMGLKAVEKKDYKKALRYFNKASSHGTKYISRRSMEQKIKLGNIQQQIEDAKKYLEQYNDDAAYIFACQIFFENKEYALLIEETNNLDFAVCPNELAKMRLLAMREKKDSRLNLATCKWFTSRRITDDHVIFYNEFFKNTDGQTELDLVEPVIFVDDEENTSENIFTTYDSKIFTNILSYVIQFRIQCFHRNYGAAYDMLSNIKEYCINKKIIPLTEYLISDFGKVFYGVSKRHSENAQFFLDMAQSDAAKENPMIKFYSYIYAGRVYEKSGVYFSKAEDAFLKAIECAQNDEDYDVAVWFLLNFKLGVSTDKCIESLAVYCKKWHNPYSFSDLLDNLSLLLFTSAKWSSFHKVYKMIDGYADNVTTSRFAYLTGRLIQTGYLKLSDEEKKAAFIKAFQLNAGTDIYYRILAAKELDIQIDELEKNIFNPSSVETASNDADAETLLRGYADFGFEDLIYPEWQYFYTINKHIFGIETICYVADFLRKRGNGFNSNYYKSLHMVSKTTNLDNSRLNRNVFELSYPKNFSKEIAVSAKEFGVDEYDMLGLIRTESFFNPVIESHAGALGLSQLMESTFDDCAKQLNISDPDITDPAINIRIGTYYYSTLVERLDGSDILALFAYNAGITRVRRWLSSSKVGLGIYKNLPSDLFLETIPFAETRNYGRKVVQSAALYAWLYYNKSPYEIIDEMM